ncbi:MAG: hypothetical protein ACXVLT_05710 [Flavisolibacter sp.]
MQVRHHRGFNIEVHKAGEGYISEIYHKGKLVHVIRNDNDHDGKFHSAALAIEAAREWIDHTYPPGRIKYFGEV